MVERSWMAAFDSPEFWNPKVRGAECLNRQAARSIVPIAELRTRMVMAGHSKAEIVSALKAAFANKQLPDLENGNMVFMMSKSAYLYDAGDHNGPHVMFFTALKDGKDWGAGASGSPVFAGPYWFLSSKEPSQAKGLPPILVFAVEVAKWSDGTAAPMDGDVLVGHGPITPPYGCDNFVTIFRRNRPKSTVVLAMAGGYDLY
jgi:hypothetical protein